MVTGPMTASTSVDSWIHCFFHLPCPHMLLQPSLIMSSLSGQSSVKEFCLGVLPGRCLGANSYDALKSVPPHLHCLNDIILKKHQITSPPRISTFLNLALIQTDIRESYPLQHSSQRQKEEPFPGLANYCVLC